MSVAEFDVEAKVGMCEMITSVGRQRRPHALSEGFIYEGNLITANILDHLRFIEKGYILHDQVNGNGNGSNTESDATYILGGWNHWLDLFEAMRLELQNNGPEYHWSDLHFDQVKQIVEHTGLSHSGKAERIAIFGIGYDASQLINWLEAIKQSVGGAVPETIGFDIFEMDAQKIEYANKVLEQYGYGKSVNGDSIRFFQGNAIEKFPARAAEIMQAEGGYAICEGVLFGQHLPRPVLKNWLEGMYTNLRQSGHMHLMDLTVGRWSYTITEGYEFTSDNERASTEAMVAEANSVSVPRLLQFGWRNPIKNSTAWNTREEMTRDYMDMLPGDVRLDEGLGVSFLPERTDLGSLANAVTEHIAVLLAKTASVKRVPNEPLIWQSARQLHETMNLPGASVGGYPTCESLLIEKK